MKNLLAVLSLAALAALVGCSTTTTISDPPATSDPIDTTSSYHMLATQVFNVSCTQCHNDQNKQGFANLSLEEKSAYAMLVGVAPTNAVAKSVGYLRVFPSHADSSFLYKKVSGNLLDGMGERMPQGGHAISAGKIEFIRQWIAAGAPKTGKVADEMLLHDMPDMQNPIVPLDPPAAGTGFQVHLAPFDIAPATEKEVFVYQPNPNTTDQYINKVKVRMRDGSHHYILYTIDGASNNLKPGELRSDVEKEMQRDRSFLFGSQMTDAEYDFPDSVAVKIPANIGFDVNSHYVNPTSGTYEGEAYINLYTMPVEKVKHVAQPFLWSDTRFSIPAKQTYTRNTKWPAATKVSHLIMLNSHAHKHMTDFKVYLHHNNGTEEMIYENTSWHEPPVKAMDLIIQPKEYLRSETTWTNETDRTITFGFTSEDEMNILVGYIWQ